MKKTFLSLFVLLCLALLPSKVLAFEKTEIEDNNTVANANLITLGDTMKGEISSSWDFDTYKVISNEAGKINLNFNITKPWDKVNQKRLYVHILGPNQEDIGMVTVDCANTETVVLPFIGAKVGTYYYIVLVPGTNMDNIGYSIRTSFTKGNDYEKEVNNTESGANKYILTKNMVGNIGCDYTNQDSDDCYDVDYYKFTSPAKGQMLISIKIKQVTGTGNLKYVLYDKYNGSDRELRKYYVPINYEGGDTFNIYVNNNVAKNKTFYLRLSSQTEDGGWAEATKITGEPYVVGSKFILASKPKMTSTKIAKTSITFKSSKLKDITGYQVQMKSGSTWKTIKNYGKPALSYTKKGLKKNKKYSFRIRTYLKKDGVTYYGNWISATFKTRK